MQPMQRDGLTRWRGCVVVDGLVWRPSEAFIPLLPVPSGLPTLGVGDRAPWGRPDKPYTSESVFRAAHKKARSQPRLNLVGDHAVPAPVFTVLRFTREFDLLTKNGSPSSAL
jgi:hypothetical protein